MDDNSTPYTIPITILLFDDDATDRDQTIAAFRAARITNSMRFVADGDQLLDYLYQRHAYAGETGAAPRPGLILVNLSLTTAAGRSALERLQNDPALSAIPIVVLTGANAAHNGAVGPMAGASATLQKPITLAGFLETLEVLDRYWLEIVELSPRGKQDAAHP